MNATHVILAPRLTSVLASALALAGCTEALCPPGTVQRDDRCVAELVRLTDGSTSTLDAAMPDGGADASVPDAAARDAGFDDAAVPPDAGEPGCPTGQRCLPAAPAGWMGPMAVTEGAGSAPSCPSTHPTSAQVVQRDLSAPPASCSCSCIVDSVMCRIFSTGSSSLWTPSRSCDTPPVEDDCLEARAIASCSTNDSISRPTPSWAAHARLCSGAAPGATCGDAATCVPRPPDPARLCVVRDGDHACPADYPNRQLYHDDLNDTRSCTSCSCSASGQSCTINLEICSLAFYDATLTTGGPAQCLNSGDGDGVTLLSQSVTSTGTCSTSGATATGSVTPVGPRTVCCAP